MGKSLRLSWQILKKSVRCAYDYVGMVMASSALWFVVGFLPLLLATTFSNYIKSPVILAAALILTLVTFGPATAAVHAMISKILAKEEVLVREYFQYFIDFFSRSVGLVWLNSLIVVILVTDFMFTINHSNKIIRAVSGIWVYAFLFWAMMSNYIFPFLVNQNIGVVLAMKRSALLALDNVLVTIVLTVSVAFIAGLSIVLAAAVLLLMMGVIAFFQNMAYRELMQKYDALPEEAIQSPEG
ncbi:MAG: DUF624 domain-containing protein [Firmicutes bacterium]|nr:DUF624 domain-containing protein [Bacillota bacterium]